MPRPVGMRDLWRSFMGSEGVEGGMAMVRESGVWLVWLVWLWVGVVSAMTGAECALRCWIICGLSSSRSITAPRDW